MASIYLYIKYKDIQGNYKICYGKEETTYKRSTSIPLDTPWNMGVNYDGYTTRDLTLNYYQEKTGSQPKDIETFYQECNKKYGYDYNKYSSWSKCSSEVSDSRMGVDIKITESSADVAITIPTAGVHDGYSVGLLFNESITFKPKPCNLKGSVYTKPGYNYTNWSTQEGYEIVKYTAGGTYVFYGSMEQHVNPINIKFWPDWETIPYTVKISAASPSSFYNTSRDINFTASYNIEKENMSLGGQIQNGTYEGYTLGNTLKCTSAEGSWEVGKNYPLDTQLGGHYGNADFEATLTPIPYNITYWHNPSDTINSTPTLISGLPVSYTVNSETISFGDDLYTWNGYTWAYNDPDKITGPRKGNIGPKTVTGYFTANTYSLVFKNEAGTEIKTYSVNFDEKYDSTKVPDDQTKYGYKFEGWETIEGELIFNPGKTPVPGNSLWNTSNNTFKYYGSSSVELRPRFKPNAGFSVNTQNGFRPVSEAKVKVESGWKDISVIKVYTENGWKQLFGEKFN